MKQVLSALILAVTCTLALADPVPPIPELEAFLKAGEVVNSNDLKARGAEVEQRFALRSYKDRLGMSEEEVRAQLPDVMMFMGYLGGGPFDRALYDRFNERVALDQDDLYLRHIALSRAFDADKSNVDLLEQMRLNILEMEKQGYSPIRVCGAAYDYRDRAEDEDDPMRDDRFMIERFGVMLAEQEFDSASRTYIFDKLIKPFVNTKSEELREAMIRAVESSPDVDAWFVQMVHGVNQQQIAWIKRGSATAFRTSEEKFAAFHHHLDQSMMHFRRAHEIDPGCPQGAHYMVRSLYPRGDTWRAEGWTWVGRCMIACIDYEPLFETLRHALQDKWQGDQTSRAELAQWAARPEFAPHGLAIQALYALERSWWTYGVDYGSADWFWEEEQGAIEAVMKSLDIHIDQQVEDNLDYEHSIMAYLEFRHHQDFKKSAEHIRACENGINRNARRKMRFDDFNIASIVLPMSMDETADIARLALSYEETGEFGNAMREWERVLKILEEKKDQVAVEAVRDRVQMCDWQERFDSRAGWVELGFDEQMNGWDPVNGTWERVDDKTVRVVKKGLDNETLLVADISTDYWFEVRARARLVSNNKRPPTFGIGYSRGNRLTDEWDQMRYLSVRLHSSLTGIGWHYAGNDYKAPLPEAAEDGWYEYRLLVKGDQVEAYINDQLVGKGEHPNWKPEKEPQLIRIALAAYNAGDETIEFSDIRIRKRRPTETIEF